ncbi:uncharacterized protein RAG0_04740 [Rhynchosporium agropyri]|uniref:Uncharacterized protein n=1 Tax=Rhynchosporium agropyri TaxID=914238 RepID=A0A1E1KA29_9HELO|nr:uncharacterized protein RAG0_04740 [Rhynchosporium agropyri]
MATVQGLATHLLALIGSHNKEIGNPPTPVRSEMLPCVLISNLMRKIPARAKRLIEITSPSPSKFKSNTPSAWKEAERSRKCHSCMSYHRVFQFRNATQHACMHACILLDLYVFIAIEVSVKDLARHECNPSILSLSLGPLDKESNPIHTYIHII